MVNFTKREREREGFCPNAWGAISILSSLAPYFGKAPLLRGFAQQLPFALDQHKAPEIAIII
jgi:hypothetical protein